MKPKDIAGIVFAVILLAVVGFVFYKSQAPKKTTAATTASTQAEVVPLINPKLDANNTLTAMANQYQVRDFKLPVDLTTGIGTTSLFGQ